MLYVYGLADCSFFAALSGAGHEDRTVFAVPCADFCAAASDIEEAIAVSPAAVWRHETVLAFLMAEHAVLPFRFGTVFEHAEALRQTVLPAPAKLREEFALVRGKVELALHLDAGPQTVPIAAGPAKGPGTAHLARLSLRVRDEERAKAVEEALRHHLGDTVGDIVCTPDEEGFKASCLVARDCLAPAREALAHLADKVFPGLRFSGPWAPYSFVGRWS